MKSEKKNWKHSQEHRLDFEDEDLRWATPEVVADYRAERLACNTIVDIGCGIGFQAFSFAKKCRKVYAIELDPKKIAHAKKNAIKLGIRNIEFIEGDALSDEVISRLRNVDVVFCDPERLPEEQERSVGTIKPDVEILLEKYGKITDKICIEFPPKIREVPFDCEREYVSFEGRVNRLNLYFGALKLADRSAVVLPENKVLRSQGTSEPLTTSSLQEYLLEIDPAAKEAELLPELCAETKASLYEDGKYSFLTAHKITRHPFIRALHRIVATSDFDREKIISALADKQAGQVVVRYEVEPSRYWEIRKGYEKDLTGTETLCLFRLGGKAIITKKL